MRQVMDMDHNFWIDKKDLVSEEAQDHNFRDRVEDLVRCGNFFEKFPKKM
jgi:hypothetical protein